MATRGVLFRHTTVETFLVFCYDPTESGALDVYRGPIGQMATYNSSTAYNYTISDEVRTYLGTGPLKYSADVYKFIESVFWQKMRANGVSL